MNMLGVNVDPHGAALPVQVLESGATVVRLPLIGNVDVRAIVSRYKAAGLRVIGVLARESMETVPASVHGDWIGWYAQQVGDLLWAVQVGNEQDHSSPSSWTQSLDTVTQMGVIARTRFPSAVQIVMGGLASGNPAYLDTEAVWPAVFDAIAVHPYTQNTATIVAFIQGYRARARGKPIWATEYAWYDRIARPLADLLPVSLVYCWQDWPGWLHGLHDLQGHQKPEYAEFQRLAKEVNRPMPEFHFGFKDYADSHPEVGKPLSDERYFAPDLSCQLAEGGLLVYAKQTNELRFLPKG